ncbi:SGNH/GDSL hydrolase family protein [Pontibacter qinzhouensis]|nr:SGNH/GDSL hydrolase family protein [Pontibacter qinzhouensis]
MKKFFYKPVMLALAAGMFLASCEPEIEVPSISAGSQLDLTKYVAVGNSLTAGFQDNGLYREGQLNSYPAILAQQFRIVGGGEFAQPLFSEAEANGSGYIKVGSLVGGIPIPEPVAAQATRGGTLPGGAKALSKYLEPVQNLGIPGISVLTSASAAYGASNPYLERLLEPAEVGNKAYIQEVLESQPTFFSMWLGSNDVLGYALAGGEPSNPTQALTNKATFENIYTNFINNLTANGAEGILVNIPDVKTVPFFTTVPYNALTLTTQAQVDALNAAYGSGALGITFTLGPNPLIVRDPDAPAGFRQIKSTELVLLPALEGIALQGYGSQVPLPGNLFLSEREIDEINDFTSSYNQVIKNIAAAKNLAFFDVNNYFNTIKGGFVMDAVTYAPTFVTGNLFSLDGIHLTPRGYAILANEMIKTINAKYSAQIPTVDATKYRAVLLP